MGSVIPEWLLTALAAVTVFTVMFSVGLGIVPGELRWIWQKPGSMIRGLFCVLIAVPAIALLITRALELPRLVEIGIVLMAVSPGAPLALRRSLAAGGHRAFAPSLQISVAILAVVSMPLSIAALNHVYGGACEHHALARCAPGVGGAAAAARLGRRAEVRQRADRRSA